MTKIFILAAIGIALLSGCNAGDSDTSNSEIKIDHRPVELNLSNENMKRDASQLFDRSATPIQVIAPEKFNPNKDLVIKSISDDAVTYDVLDGTGYIQLMGNLQI